MRHPELAGIEENEWGVLDKGLIPLLKAGKRVLRTDLPPDNAPQMQ